MSSSIADAVPPPPSLPAHDVIYENAEMLVVNKPPDVPMDGDLRVYPFTVESMVHEHMRKRGIYDDEHERLQQEGKRKKQLKFVHQLDYSTSGVLCLAFIKDTAARLAHCFEMRTTRKYYVALLHGHVPATTITQAPTDADLSKEEVTSIRQRQTDPFQEWTAQCQSVWRDLGSVRADACSGFSAEKNEKALGEFHFLLSSSSAGGSDGAAAGQDEAHTPTVHRHHGTSYYRNTTSRDAVVHDATVYQLIAEASTASSGCSLTVDLPIGYDGTDPEHFRMAVTTEQGRPASTSLLVLKQGYMNKPLASSSPADTREPVTLVLLSPHTGRRHQLRVHCRAIGFPIVGDKAYCADLPWCRPVTPAAHTSIRLQSPAPRMYLHAWRLLLPGAVTPQISESERVALKKKRRRETLNLSERSDAAVSVHRNEWTEFVAPVHFPHVVMDD
ncbi:hypothetical protein ABL78_0453 [Leptomonas seymouri]|uniref:Pseudouridine synthase RsuA/RluA-like domain-containing protein n=1 Tax=Leptomonas seymouri TaxID=5684 RepID=A0A0N0P976_LEPSE|nr:hypothetical protein ABL78_0453 [Leptomonas seymouri]|eukprot:KPI90377.1 hypothetical protein ABL78_0453 [Leptomonas seymouri]